MVLSDEVISFLKKKRFYVFFPDGTWRTTEEDQWKAERLWKLADGELSTGWFGLSDFDLKAIQAVIERYEL